MSNQIELMPEKFFASVFAYYGTNASSFIMLSGVVISGLGLSKIVNPTIWLAAAITAMIAAFSFRAYVSSKYLGTAASCLVAAVLLLAASIYAVPDLHLPVRPGALPLMQAVGSYVLFATLASLICICFISYKKHSAELADETPEAILASVRKYITDCPLHFSRFEYVLSAFPGPRKDWLRMEMLVTYELRNRTGAIVQHTARYPTQSESFRLNGAAINGRDLDVDDPALIAGDGVAIPIFVEPKGAVKVVVSVTKVFQIEDSDLFTVYDYPAESFTCSLTDHTNSDLRIRFEALNRHNKPWTRDGRRLTWSSSGAILPNQGIRAIWERRK